MVLPFQVGAPRTAGVLVFEKMSSSCCQNDGEVAVERESEREHTKRTETPSPPNAEPSPVSVKADAWAKASLVAISIRQLCSLSSGDFHDCELEKRVFSRATGRSTMSGIEASSVPGVRGLLEVRYDIGEFKDGCASVFQTSFL